jgi:hypothetical protein
LMSKTYLKSDHFNGGGSPPPGVNRPRAARYQLALDEVDELVKLIFQIENINPQFYTGFLDEDAKRYLNYRNKFPIE